MEQIGHIPSTSYLIRTSVVVGLAAASFGMAIVSTDELSNTYAHHMDWTTKTEKSDKTTWITSASALGLMIGSLLSSTIIKIGRRKSILLAAFVQLIAIGFQFWLTFWAQVGSKIVFGASSAVQLTACAVYLSETLPPEKVATYGFAVNLGVTVGISIQTVIGVFLPDDGKGNLWTLVNFAMLVLCLTNIVLWAMRGESIGYCVAKEDKEGWREQALKAIS